MAEAVPAMLLRLAAIDAAACRALAAAPDMADSVIGFHAQQASEKCLKAVLSARGIEFERTHDLARLLDLLAAHAIDVPAIALEVDALNPYAVQARYGLVGEGQLNRLHAQAMVDALLGWAQSLVHAADSF